MKYYIKTKTAKERLRNLKILTALGVPIHVNELSVTLFDTDYSFGIYPVIIYNEEKHQLSGGRDGYSDGHEVSLIELIEIVERPKPVCFTLNDKYNAEVLYNGNVKVGCQEFTAAKILELAELVKKALEANGQAVHYSTKQ